MMTLEFMLVSRLYWSLELRTMIVTTFICDFIIRSIDSRVTPKIGVQVRSEH